MITTDVRKELNTSAKLVSKIKKIRVSEERCLIMDFTRFCFSIFFREKHFVEERANWQIVSPPLKKKKPHFLLFLFHLHTTIRDNRSHASLRQKRIKIRRRKENCERKKRVSPFLKCKELRL